MSWVTISPFAPFANIATLDVIIRQTEKRDVKERRWKRDGRARSPLPSSGRQTCSLQPAPPVAIGETVIPLQPSSPFSMCFSRGEEGLSAE